MKPRDLIDLLMLAALWGGSFLFLRVAVPEFGPIALIALRVGIAALFLLAVLAVCGRWAQMRAHAVPLTLVGVINSALPFCLFAYATLSVTAGFASILNATTPLWGAIVAHLWLRERLGAWRIAGLVLGLAGIVVLVWGRIGFSAGSDGLAILAALGATASYGVAACYSRRRLADVDPLVVATGSQAGAAVLLAPLAAFAWPAQPASATAWASVAVMGLASTGLAYILYFRLIARAGPTQAVSVTFLVPVFATAWGALLLGERVTGRMLAGGLVVLAGTALATGLIRPPGRASSSRDDATAAGSPPP